MPNFELEDGYIFTSIDILDVRITDRGFYDKNISKIYETLFKVYLEKLKFERGF